MNTEHHMDRMAEQTCGIHGDKIVYEEGGPTMPTLYGRHYCPTCQAAFIEALS